MFRSDLGPQERRALLTWSGAIEPGWRASDAITVATVLMGVAVCVVSRRAVIAPKLKEINFEPERRVLFSALPRRFLSGFARCVD